MRIIRKFTNVKRIGVNKEIAEKAGWSPADDNFHVSSSGWVKFLTEIGTIYYLTSLEEAEISSLLFQS